MESQAATVGERRIVLLAGAVLFVNILDFMMVMPMGPDFARALGIPLSRLGLIGGSYTASAAVSGMVGALFLDRFDRRKALAVVLLGLVIGTATGGLARGLVSLMAARIIAGAFGGPAASLALSLIADVVPIERRGRAMGAAMGAFSAASVLGIPAGLELARLGGWRMPFFAVAALGAAVAATALLLMPPMVHHLRERREAVSGLFRFLGRPTVALSLAGTVLVMMGNFAVVPNLSAYLQFNLGVPRERLGLLYLVGGAVSFATMRLSGSLVDRLGAPGVAALGTAAYAAVLYALFIHPVPVLPVLALFAGYMVTSTFRVIPMQAISSRVPTAHERARFMSVQSSVQHLSAAAGALLSAWMLRELPGGRLEGMGRVSGFSIALAALLPFLLWRVERGVLRREKDAGLPAV